MAARKRPAWESSTRRSRLPADWASRIRPAVLRRDGFRCQLRYADLCLGVASDVDHRRAGDDHSLENLQAACAPCHRRKSALEGAAARPRMFRPAETHPALE